MRFSPVKKAHEKISWECHFLMRISWESHEILMSFQFSWEKWDSHEQKTSWEILMRIGKFSWECHFLMRISWDSHENSKTHENFCKGKEKRAIFCNFRQPPNTLHIHSSDRERTWPEAHCHVCDCREFSTMCSDSLRFICVCFLDEKKDKRPTSSQPKSPPVVAPKGGLNLRSKLQFLKKSNRHSQNIATESEKKPEMVSPCSPTSAALPALPSDQRKHVHESHSAEGFSKGTHWRP